MTASSEPTRTPRMFTPQKVVVQSIGWLVGIGLLVWVIKEAAATGDWQKLREADAWLVAALLGCSAVSAIANGTTFWITIQPIRRVKFVDMQWLNLVSNMLNYAPVRLGAVSRIVYHLRVDRLSLFQVGAWFAFIAYVLILGVGACLLATLIHDQIDWIWFGIVIAQMIFGALVMRFFVSNKLITRYGAGVDKIVLNARGLWGAVILRLIDLAAYTGRMAAALAILGKQMSPTHVIVLAVVALTASLIPFGRLGFREFCVAAVATRLSMHAQDVEQTWEDLALVESAGEAIIFIPAGAFALIWFLKRLRKSRGE